MNRAEQAKWAITAAEWMKDHAYTELVNANGVEVWRCMKPGSSDLAFDICVTRFGISVFGDIGSLTWTVGASYGIPFLAGKDGDYIHRKLEKPCKETEFDIPGFIARVEDSIFDVVTESLEGGYEWMQDHATRKGRGAELEAWLLTHSENSSECRALCVALREAKAFGDEDTEADAHEWLADHEKLIEVSETHEWNLSRPTDSVYLRLARVRHAAQMIMAQKEAAQPQAVAQ